MKPKEIQEKLGINADRIKFFKKQGVFTPENPPSGNRGTNYTETDYNKSEHQVSRETGVPQRTIHDRKIKILAKLKRLMNE